MHIDYSYTHTKTLATTGYFSCEPPASLNLELALRQLEETPFDTFLHQHLLRILSAKTPEELFPLAATCYSAEENAFLRPGLAALLLECSLLVPTLRGLCLDFPRDAPSRLARLSPTVHLRIALQPDRPAAEYWNEVFRSSICGHHPLPRLDEADMPPLFAREEMERVIEDFSAHKDTLLRNHALLSGETPPGHERTPANETCLRALDALMEAGVVAEPEKRHEASLSPFALLRSWRVDIRVANGGLSHTLSGHATAYGRGLSLAQARASCAMEIVERACAYVDIARRGLTGGVVPGRRKSLELTRASYADLRAGGYRALDPEALPLDAPYRNERLHWIPAEDCAGGEVLVPAQAVFLFCNLDEQELFLGGGSTGLAAGNTSDEARVAALGEILERDAEATTPFSRERCFVLKSRDARIQALLDDYDARGIRVQFMDLTTEFGLPVYRCFVMAPDGAVFRATAGKLKGAAAALAALTETPWPYSPSVPAPSGRPSGAGLGGLPCRVLEDLPDFSLPNPGAELRLLEKTLQQHGKAPLYVDLTRSDMGIPVVRAIIPGLETTPDRDSFSSPPQRLFARAWAMCR